MIIMDQEKANQYLMTAVQAALSAGSAISAIYRSGFTITEKEDLTPLTEADLAAHRIILEALSPGGELIISEEGRSAGQEEMNPGSFWLVDPLDGTKEFIRRNGEFTVNIAFIESQRPVLGVIYAPVMDMLYFGLEGSGAFAVRKASRQCPPVISYDTLLAKSVTLKCGPQKTVLTVAASRSHFSPETGSLIKKLESGFRVKLLSKGSSLKLTAVAEGSADVYPRLAPTMEWDTAAGDAILRAAGGSCRIYPEGTLMTYQKPGFRNPSFVACADPLLPLIFP